MAPKIVIAIRPYKVPDQRKQFLFRIGYTKRGAEEWLKKYRKDGFMLRHLQTVHPAKGQSLDQNREELLKLIAQRLGDSNIQVTKYGEADYCYVISDKRPVVRLLESIEHIMPPTEEEGPSIVTEVKASASCVMM